MSCPLDVPVVDPAEALGGRVREGVGLPSVGEAGIARHHARLAARNFGVDTGPYPLGSCTMKYNPRVAEDAARLAGFADLHPYQPEGAAQGALELMWELQEALAEVSGLPGVSLSPAAGAHGELTALLVFRAYHTAEGDPRRRVIVPDTAHGTNPATVSMCGYDVEVVPSDERGLVDVDALESLLDRDVAGIMLTNPNTLGLFERDIGRITDAVHAVGALAYCDGANMNAILGKTRPGDMGFDALHLNLHKTFGTPHGGGGPGAGPVAVSERLAAFLPAPVVARDGRGGFSLEEPPRSIGRVRSFHGNVSVLVRAYAYLRALGADGLEAVSEQAVLSANYLLRSMPERYDVPHGDRCMHEFVASAGRLRKEHDVRALDVAKGLIDRGIHPPTIYFPLIVDEALMIEPTETATLDDLDAIVAALDDIGREAEASPDTLRSAPHQAPVTRVDEARAAREPDLRYRRP